MSECDVRADRSRSLLREGIAFQKYGPVVDKIVLKFFNRTRLGLKRERGSAKNGFHDFQGYG